MIKKFLIISTSSRANTLSLIHRSLRLQHCILHMAVPRKSNITISICANRTSRRRKVEDGGKRWKINKSQDASEERETKREIYELKGTGIAGPKAGTRDT